MRNLKNRFNLSKDQPLYTFKLNNNMNAKHMTKKIFCPS